SDRPTPKSERRPSPRRSHASLRSARIPRRHPLRQLHGVVHPPLLHAHRPPPEGDLSAARHRASFGPPILPTLLCAAGRERQVPLYRTVVYPDPLGDAPAGVPAGRLAPRGARGNRGGARHGGLRDGLRSDSLFHPHTAELLVPAHARLSLLLRIPPYPPPQGA